MLGYYLIMEKDFVYYSMCGWTPAQGPTALGCLLCCYFVWLILQEILGNVGLNMRKLGGCLDSPSNKTKSSS